MNQLLYLTEELITQIAAQVDRGELPNMAEACSWTHVSEEAGSQLTVTSQQERSEVPLLTIPPVKKEGKQIRKVLPSKSKNTDHAVEVRSIAAVDEGRTCMWVQTRGYVESSLSHTNTSSEPESVTELYEHTKQKLKQDSFFL